MVSVPVVVSMTRATLPPAAPPRVSPKPAPEIADESLRVMVPLPPTTELLAPKVNEPE